MKEKILNTLKKIQRQTRSVMSQPKPTTKRGVASMYIVIFATLVFGIITLSFVHIILSESAQTTNSDLSQSAYDSALAGIEDGKVAVLKYHECLSQGFTADSLDTDEPCVGVIQAMEAGIRDGSCDTVTQTLKRLNPDGSWRENTGQEVPVQEAGNATDGLLQAYTCVKIAETLRDYRSTLGSNSGGRTRVVPLRTVDEDTTGAGVPNFTHVKFSWYSTVNAMNLSRSSTNLDGGVFPGGNNNDVTPPPMGITFIQTDANFNLNELSASSGETGGTDIARLTLYPSSTGSNTISADAVAASAAKTINKPTMVKCSSTTSMEWDNDTGNIDDEFACSVTIKLPETFNGSTTRNLGSMFMVVSLLYGQPITDFSIELCKTDSCAAVNTEDTSGGLAYFAGVQTSIDSTGRANDLYRRVETRIELYDINFPYPEYVIQMDKNGSGAGIFKDFYITKNCWYTNSTPLGETNSDADFRGNVCQQNNASR